MGCASSTDASTTATTTPDALAASQKRRRASSVAVAPPATTRRRHQHTDGSTGDIHIERAEALPLTLFTTRPVPAGSRIPHTNAVSRAEPPSTGSAISSVRRRRAVSASARKRMQLQTAAWKAQMDQAMIVLTKTTA